MNELDRLEKAFGATLEAVREKMPNNKVVLVYLTGSRLYGYAKETSDYDFKVYVEPTERELKFNKKVSRSVAVDRDMVESVDVKSVLYLVEELKKPTVNSLHLLFKPMFLSSDLDENDFLFGDSKYFQFKLENSVMHSFRVNRKNLGLSMLGAVKTEKQREKRVCFSMMIYLLSHDLYNTGFLVANDVRETGELSKYTTGFDKNFDCLQEKLFNKWLDVTVEKDTADYESLFL